MKNGFYSFWTGCVAAMTLSTTGVVDVVAFGASPIIGVGDVTPRGGRLWPGLVISPNLVASFAPFSKIKVEKRALRTCPFVVLLFGFFTLARTRS